MCGSKYWIRIYRLAQKFSTDLIHSGARILSLLEERRLYGSEGVLSELAVEACYECDVVRLCTKGYGQDGERGLCRPAAPNRC